MSRQRKKFWVHNLQTRLMLRVALYCLSFQLTTVFLLLALLRVDTLLHGKSVEAAIPTKLAIIGLIGALLGAVFIWDALRLTHRLVGPLVRFQRTVEQIHASQEAEPIRLRKDDLLHDLAASFNSMLEGLGDRGAVRLKKIDDRPQPAGSFIPWHVVAVASILIAIVASYVCWLPIAR